MNPLLKGLLKSLDLDAIAGIDYETYYDDDYSLKKMPTTEYVYDSRFETQLVAVQITTWNKPRVFMPDEFEKWAKTIDWSRTGWLSHHTQFDALIGSRHHGIRPKFYFDTLSMARPIMPVQVGGSLHALATAFGMPGKRYGSALVNVKGVRLRDFTKAMLRDHKRYAGDDIYQTWGIFWRLLPYTQFSELRLIDLTMRMYAQPSVLLDRAMLLRVAQDEVIRKETFLERTGVTKEQLMSNPQFAELLEAAGIDPPMKKNKNGEMIHAFAKTDLEFKDLLEHPSEVVTDLVNARLGVKSTIAETRAIRMANRAVYGAQPIYLNYWGAGPGRWSGGDKINWQNMTRGSDIRKSILAPPGHSLIIADLSQIEARLVAWFAGQANIVEAFARGEDVYCIAASLIYGRKITKADKEERFVGKVAVLALGYQAGWSRFATMLRIGQFGPPLRISDMEAQAAHRAWRQANPYIVANWKATQNKILNAFSTKTRVEDRCVAYEGVGNNGFMHLPNGTSLRYSNLAFDDGLSYSKKIRNGKDHRVRLYGGIEVENRTQALARIVIGDHMLAISDLLPYWRQALTTHDEIVGVVPNRYAQRALKVVNAVMVTSPLWAPDLPLAVEAHISERYDK